jgi:hypothetical protein
MPEFHLIFPTFLAKCAELHDLLLSIAYGLFVVGVMVRVSHGFSNKTLFLFLVRLMILTALLVFLPKWGNSLQQTLQVSILDGLGVDPTKVYDQYSQLLAVKRDTGSTQSWWDRLSDLSGFSVEILISAILWLFGYFAGLLLFWAYVFQKVILQVGYALSPLLIGFMAIQPLRHVGNRYLTHLLGVILWPLSWGVAALITQAILDFMTDPALKYLEPSASLYGLQATFGLAVLAFWITFSTVAAPILIQGVLSQGAPMGSQLLSGAVGTFLQTAATTAGATATASSMGVPAVTAAAAGVAAGLSTLSTAAGQGSAGAILIAGSGLPPRSARGRPGDDITGDKSVRELIAKTKNHYF